ncbi:MULTISPECIES: hypothetical protein [Burkholderia]|uniref:hypothetical protein n=1 Tax=Burkholderia TaxID=32008 RepID=UPI000F55CC9D|nr:MULTISPECIES: hypothetical protein [Burkholderia]
MVKIVNFYVLKILAGGGAVFPVTEVYGDVEIRPASTDDETEAAAISDSAFEKFPKDEQQIAARIATIVRATSIEEAIRLADEKFVPILDLLSAKFALSDFSLTQVGHVKNLDDGSICPIKSNFLGPSLTFIVPRGVVNKSDFEHWIIRQKTDLAERYKRSLHWARNAKWEKSTQMAILYRWFSVEALFKESENDNISSLLLLYLGFPGGTYSKDISRDLLSQLSKNESWVKWKKLLQGIVEKIRIFRNDSVHSGFRSVDYTADELVLYNTIMTYAASRCQGAVRDALMQRIDTVSDFKSYAGVVFENRGNVVGDIIGNIVFSLDNNVSTSARRA